MSPETESLIIETLATELETKTKRTRAEINRENAQKSTGPRTEQGKAKSRLNATRHKLTGQIALLPEGDFQAYSELLEGFIDQYNPQTLSESALVAQIANATWRLNQSHSWEMLLMALDYHPEHPSISQDNPEQVIDALAQANAVRKKTRELGNLSLYRTRDFRIFQTATKLLKAEQAERKAKEMADLAAASDLMHLHDLDEASKQKESKKAAAPYQPVPYDPTADGFVFSIDQIVKRVERARRDARIGTLAWIGKGAAA